MKFSDSFYKDVEKLEVPSYPFYGYDNSEEIDKDMSYIKSLYPTDVQKVQKEVDEECDKLEYDGSCMFDSAPDRVQLSMIVDEIFDRLFAEPVEETELSKNNMDSWRDCNGRNCSRRPPRPDFDPDGRPNWRRNLIESLLFNEILHRRRRRRRRKRWNH